MPFVTRGGVAALAAFELARIGAEAWASTRSTSVLKIEAVQDTWWDEKNIRPPFTAVFDPGSTAMT